MMQVAIVKRRLRPGKTYDDFRRAWFHHTGFGTRNRMLTVVNSADPREIIVIGLTEANLEQVQHLVEIDVAERSSNPLDEVVEPQIERMFGVLVAEDDFSSAGPIGYRPAAVDGHPTDFDEITRAIEAGQELLARVLRDREPPR